MIQARKIKNTGLATIGLIGAFLFRGSWAYVISIYARATGLYSLMMAFLSLFGFLFFFNIDFYLDNFVLLLNFPAIVYVNADIDKLNIIKENKGKSGVYCWKNNANGKTYIGSSVNIGKRLTNYYNYDFLSRPNHKMLIYKALLKYGYSQFSLEILEYCEPSTTIEREQYYIDYLKPEYNILKIAGSSLGYQHSEETRTKIAAALKGVNNPMYGKKRIHSKKTLAKLSASKKGMVRVLGAGKPSHREAMCFGFTKQCKYRIWFNEFSS